VLRVQLTINAMLVIIRSGNERVRRVAKLTNIIEPEYVLSGNKLRAHTNLTGTKLHYGRTAVRSKNPRNFFVSRSLFRMFGAVMQQNLIE